MKLPNVTKVASACLMALVLSACGTEQTESIMKNIEYSTFQQNNEVFVRLKSEIDTQSIVVSAASLPIYDKKNPNRLLGQVDITSDLDTLKSTLIVTLNTTISLNLPSFNYESKLPNGLNIPISGVDMSKIIAFEVGEKGSKVYVHYDHTTKKAFLGVALNIEALNIGTPASIFAVFNQNNIKGLAGFYFGDKVNTSGVGVFANLTGLLSSNQNMNMVTAQKLSSDLQFIPVNNYSEVKHLVNWKFFKLQNSHRPLIVK